MHRHVDGMHFVTVHHNEVSSNFMSLTKKMGHYLMEVMMCLRLECGSFPKRLKLNHKY